MDRMGGWRNFYEAPLWLVGDYMTVMAGEALAEDRAKKGKAHAIADAPPGFDLVTEEG